MHSWIPAILAPVLCAALTTAPQTRELTQPTTTRPAALDVGSAAPPIRAASWLNGNGVAVHERGAPAVFVVTFWAPSSGPCRDVLADLVRLQDRYRARGVVFVGLTEEPAEPVRSFLAGFEPKVTFPLAIDDSGATTRAYCEAAGVGFVPYAFVIGPDRTIAWHGHPRQPEMVTIVEELLSGRYDRDRAVVMVRQARSIEQLETLFRDACANQSWHTALLTLDALLERDVPKQRLLRYKLSILLGELDDCAQAGELADELTKRYAADARFLNSVAWDVVSQPRLPMCDPGIGLRLAQAAYRASHGQDAAIADTYARALHLIGRVDLAIQVQTRAVELSTPEQRGQHERMLKFYQRCQELQAEASADPK